MLGRVSLTWLSLDPVKKISLFLLLIAFARMAVFLSILSVPSFGKLRVFLDLAFLILLVLLFMLNNLRSVIELLSLPGFIYLVVLCLLFSFLSL